MVRRRRPVVSVTITVTIACSLAGAAGAIASPRSAAGSAPSPAPAVKLLAPRTQSSGCMVAALPDRPCSPGAIDPVLTKAVICSPSFRTSTVRNVTAGVRRELLVAYGLEPRAYGRAMEIDHIVSLELGGSNDIANLFPEPGAEPASYHDKDKLENRLHRLVCAGEMTLRRAQRGIAGDWVALYREVFVAEP